MISTSSWDEPVSSTMVVYTDYYCYGYRVPTEEFIFFSEWKKCVLEDNKLCRKWFEHLQKILLKNIFNVSDTQFTPKIACTQLIK